MNKKQVKLNAPHTHDGCEHKKGDCIEVTEKQALWLESLGVATIEVLPKEAVAAAKAPVTTKPNTEEKK